MTDRPILFSGPMVRAILEGRKTQTRRVLKPRPSGLWPSYIDGVLCGETTATPEMFSFEAADGSLIWTGPTPMEPGDRLWVREAWNVPDAYLQPENRSTALGIMNYRATPWAEPGKWRPSIHMPRWASRLTLVVTDVRVQRVQEITNADAVSEGIDRLHEPDGFRDYLSKDPSARVTFRASFRTLWDSLNAKRGFGWDANPWVVAYTFTPHQTNIDQMEVDK